jgi:hypothetical protein
MIYASDKPPLTHNRYEQKFEFMFVLSKGKPKSFNPIMVACTNAGSQVGGTQRHSSAGVLEKKHKQGSIHSVKIKGNIWTYNTGSASLDDKCSFLHPATFPESLGADHIKSWSLPDDLVFDPFCGSGTTAKMAMRFGRRFLGCEISPEYVKIAEHRINNEARTPGLFSNL